MNRILNKNFSSIFLTNPCQSVLKFKFTTNFNPTSSTKSYQTQLKTKKLNFQKENQKYTQLITLTDKQECLEQLKQTSESLVSDLKSLKWLKDIEDSKKQIKLLNSAYDLNLIKLKYLKSAQLNSLVDFIDRNLAQFNTKEKAIVFKIFSIINRSSNSVDIKSKSALLNQKS